MAKRTRRLILENVLETLQGIAARRGFATTPTVQPVLRDWEAARRADLLPFIGFAPMRMLPPQQLGFATYRVVMPVTVTVHATGATHAAAHETVDELLDDTLAALSADPSRCGAAIDTRWTGDDTTDGDDVIFDGEYGVASGVQTWEIVFERTSTRSGA